MSPNFSNGDYVLVGRIDLSHPPAGRGEVVVFHDPEITAPISSKRVIGLPGEKVTIASDTVTIYNRERHCGIRT